MGVDQRAIAAGLAKLKEDAEVLDWLRANSSALRHCVGKALNELGVGNFDPALLVTSLQSAKQAAQARDAELTTIRAYASTLRRQLAAMRAAMLSMEEDARAGGWAKPERSDPLYQHAPADRALRPYVSDPASWDALGIVPW